MKLGIIIKDGKIINHRSLLKVLINPILRRFGYYIGSIVNNEKIEGLKILRGQKTNKIIYDFNYTNNYDYIIKTRRIY